MGKMALAIDIEDCYPEIKSLLTLIPFPIAEFDFWQAILNVWLAKYADSRKDLNVIVREQVDLLLSYRSESMHEHQNEIEYKLTSIKSGMMYLTKERDLIVISSNHRGVDFSETANQMVDELVTASVLLASNKAFRNIYGTINSYFAGTFIHLRDIELIGFTPKALIVHLEI